MPRKPKYIEGKNYNIYVPFSVKEMPMEGNETPEVLTISGFANYSGDLSLGDTCCYIDRTNDVVVPAGMDVANYKKNPVILFNHDRDYPIGKAVDVQKRPDGIWITAEIHLGAMEDEDFYAIKSGIINSFSIGFRTKAVEWKTINDQDVCFITKSELFETSCVTIPANPESQFAVIKSFGTDCFSAAQFEEKTTQPPAATEVKTQIGEDTMKLKRKELLSDDVQAQLKAAGLEADLEGEVEVSTKSFIESLVAKQFAALEAKLTAMLDEKFKSAEVPSEETPANEEQPASEEGATEEATSEEGEVETENDEAEAIKSLSATIAESLKALKAE